MSIWLGYGGPDIWSNVILDASVRVFLWETDIHILKNFYFFLSTTTPAAYGSFQARGQIGAIAGAYTTGIETLDLNLICELNFSLWERWILNPLSGASIESTSSWTLCGILNMVSYNRN